MSNTFSIDFILIFVVFPSALYPDNFKTVPLFTVSFPSIFTGFKVGSAFFS
jgi:hypothetical protein